MQATEGKNVTLADVINMAGGSPKMFEEKLKSVEAKVDAKKEKDKASFLSSSYSYPSWDLQVGGLKSQSSNAYANPSYISAGGLGFLHTPLPPTSIADVLMKKLG